MEILVFLFITSILCKIPESEMQTLKDMFQSLGGENWANKSGWLQGDPCEIDWYGIDCKDDHIVGVGVNSNGLTGYIPESIGNLTELKVLGLEWNKNIGGVLPTTIGKLTNLIILTMPNNQIGGKIPDSISNLVNLCVLHLGANQFSSLPSNGVFTKMVNLYSLGVSNCQLTFCPDDGPQLVIQHRVGWGCNLSENQFPKGSVPEWAIKNCRVEPGEVH